MSSLHTHGAVPWETIAASLNAESGLKTPAAANPSPGGFPGASELLSREARPSTAGALPWGEIASAMNVPGGVKFRARASHAAAAAGGFNSPPRQAAPTTTGSLPWSVVAAWVDAEAGFTPRAGEEYCEPDASPLGEAETSSLSPGAARIWAILYSPAAKGREQLARHLAYTTDMSAEAAISALVAASGDYAPSSPAAAQTYRAPPAPVAASAPSSSPVVASPPSPSPTSRPNTMREGAQEVLVRAQLDQVSVRDRKPGAAYPPYPGVDSPYDAGIEPRSVKIQSEYKAARAAGRPGGCGDFWYWLAENYPPAPNSARG